MFFFYEVLTPAVNPSTESWGRIFKRFLHLTYDALEDLANLLMTQLLKLFTLCPIMWYFVSLVCSYRLKEDNNPR